jgi:hypothetical protein
MMGFLHQVALVSMWLGLPLLGYSALTCIFWWAANPWDRVTVLRVSGALLATVAFWLGAALGSGGCGGAFIGAILAPICVPIAIAISVRLPRTSRMHRITWLVLAFAPLGGAILGLVLGLALPTGNNSCP